MQKLAAVAVVLISFFSSIALGSPPTKRETLSVDTPRATAAGTQFVAPAGWSLEAHDNVTILTPPEGGSYVTIVDVDAKDADAAVAAAWQASGAGKKWPLKIAEDRVPRDGWDSLRDYVYETSANDKRSVVVGAASAGGHWTVSIYDFANDLDEKRGAQVALIFDRMMPKGKSRETFAGKAAHPLDEARVEVLKQFVESARQQLDVPGIGLGIIDHGKVVFAGGLGMRELGKPEKVDADTLFMIASNTKAMTTLMLAREVDEKKFDWDTPVTTLLPTFKLGSPDTTQHVLVKHLICACTGMPRQDLEWLFNSAGATPETIMATLGTMQPTSKFGELFQYSNLMAAAAGYMGGHVEFPDRELGAAYDAAVLKEVFEPLGMKSTTLDNVRALHGNHATPHGFDVDGKTAVAPMDVNLTVVAARPAGGAWSNINDMLRYVQMELNDGALPDGKPYVSKSALLKRREKQVAIGNDAIYGMGLMVDKTWGVPVVHHGGDLVGFHSDMMWLPDQGVGAVILTNSDRGPAIRYYLQRRLLEVLFDGKSQAVPELANRSKQFLEEVQAERKRLVVPADAAESAKLAAHYANAALGKISVSHEGNRTLFDFGAWHSEVASRKNDDGTLSFITIDPGEGGSEFVVADNGSEKTLLVRDAQHEYRYEASKSQDGERAP